jgi:hypothetical protein
VEPTDDEHIPYAHAFMVTREFQRAVTAAILPQQLVTVAICGVVVLAFALSWSLLLNVGGPFLGGVLLAIGMPLIVYVGIRRRVARQLPVGQVLRSGFGASGLRLGGSRGSSTMVFDELESFDVCRDLVRFRVRTSRQRYVSPRALFPDDEVIRIRAAISARTGRSQAA